MNLPKAIQWHGSDTMTNTEESPKRPSFQTPPAMVLVTALTVACWGYFLAGAGTGMNVWSVSTLQFPPPTNLLPIANPSAPGSVLPMIGMWWSMMLAMMIPGTFQHFPTAATQQSGQTSTLLWFGLGYATVWLVFSIAAVCLQFIFVQSELVHGMTMWSISDRFSATLLGIAGVYQFTAFKTQSLDNCRHDTGSSASRLDGFRYGIRCLLSSFALMLLLFVGGVMNVYWVVLLTVIVAIERTLTDPTPFRRGVGLACLVAGMAALTV